MHLSEKVQAHEPRHGVSNIPISPRQPEVPPLHSTPHDFTATPVLTTEQCTTYAVGRLRHRPDETSSSDLLRNLPRNREITLFLHLPTTRKRHSLSVKLQCLSKANSAAHPLPFREVDKPPLHCGISFQFASKPNVLVYGCAVSIVLCRKAVSASATVSVRYVRHILPSAVLV